MSVAKINDTYYDSLAAAITASKTIDGDVTITLVSDTEFSSAITVTKNITINGKYKILRAKTYLGTFMTINAGVTVTLNDITIDGNHNWSFDREGYDELLYSGTKTTAVDQFTTYEEGSPIVTGITFNIKGTLIVDGITIQNKVAKGVTTFKVAADAKLFTSNSTFKHIHCSSGNSVASVTKGGVWTINEGTHITGNHAGGNGGICRSDGHIIMNDALIDNNTAINCNGTVFQFYGNGSYFEMNGGIVRNNSGCAGLQNGRNASIYMHSASTMVMNGGTIEVNVGYGCGGIDAPYTNNNSTVTIYGGSVINNTSIAGNETNDIRGASGEGDAIYIYGGTFTQDVNVYAADGFSIQMQADGTFTCVDRVYEVYVGLHGAIQTVEVVVCVDGTIKTIEGICQCIDGVVIQS